MIENTLSKFKDTDKYKKTIKFKESFIKKYIYLEETINKKNHKNKIPTKKNKQIYVQNILLWLKKMLKIDIDNEKIKNIKSTKKENVFLTN
ncbi:hypothetical protein BpHYR1_046260 [Brachionus plicatilis]|uniref:Uncharacterized protein n=1 Tax=Brachionus plicatilis TaxID=10195 RepID=A0A3M7S523_BRAPC|nr:hypothetical protein BpHYR1_046260 [Brachionus plicatilis]